jgi:hypothetical protein
MCKCVPKTETILFSKHRPPPPPRRLPETVQIDNASVPWASDVKYLGLLLNPKLLYTEHLRTVTNKATSTLCNIFLLLTWHSTLSQTSKLTLHKLLIRSLLTYATPVCNTTCDSNYLKLQVAQNKSLRVIGVYPRENPISNLDWYRTWGFIHPLTVKCFAKCPSQPTPGSSNRKLYSSRPERWKVSYRMLHGTGVVNSSVVNGPSEGPGRTALYVGLLSEWGSVDGNCIIFPVCYGSAP